MDEVRKDGEGEISGRGEVGGGDGGGGGGDGSGGSLRETIGSKNS